MRPSALRLQVYAYASSVFREAGIPEGKVQYAVLGTGSCELLAACLSVSLSWAQADPLSALRGGWGALTLGGLKSSALSPFPLQVTMLKWGDLASIY